MRGFVPFFLPLVLACSDYEVNAIAPETRGADDSAQLAVDTGFELEDDCVESSTAFDIEEVSALQDAFGLPRVRDGLTLELDASTLQGDRSWRPVAVYVLVMYPRWYFDFYDDSNELTVSFYPRSNPMGAPFSKTVQIRKSELDWAALLLPPDADWSGDERDQISAWLEFDLRDVVPEEGYTTTDYFVALGWDSIGYPNVGYSNFELNCSQNWTDYGNGSYVQNSGQDCSWPMMKIEIETVLPGDCE
jgi:hypothetical protein